LEELGVVINSVDRMWGRINGLGEVKSVVPCRKARKGKDRGKDDVDGPK
jgi:hypothetical protein